MGQDRGRLSICFTEEAQCESRWKKSSPNEEKVTIIEASGTEIAI
jgi:hypothetical protein